MSEIIKTGAFELEIVSPVAGGSSLVGALLDQRARFRNSTVNPESLKFLELSEIIIKELRRIGCYHSEVPRIVQQAEVYRELAKYLQVAIEIRFPDGLARTYPYRYRLDETVYRIFCDNQRYHSVTRVRELQITP